MAVIYSSTVKESRMRCVLDAIDGSAGPATLEIGSASFASARGDKEKIETSSAIDRPAHRILTLVSPPWC
jgi:hypothetical protein